eukprot:602707_1
MVSYFAPNTCLRCPVDGVLSILSAMDGSTPDASTVITSASCSSSIATTSCSAAPINGDKSTTSCFILCVSDRELIFAQNEGDISDAAAFKSGLNLFRQLQCKSKCTSST